MIVEDNFGILNCSGIKILRFDEKLPVFQKSLVGLDLQKLCNISWKTMALDEEILSSL